MLNKILLSIFILAAIHIICDKIYVLGYVIGSNNKAKPKILFKEGNVFEMRPPEGAA